ncbi:MAG TPA: cation diffusion facilitator family transporter [Candidatus Krumholzibacteria bacterium]|nr:cation diffusion facilitator family transporter [Candidatus Krumholzibacteria bacterium]
MSARTDDLTVAHDHRIRARIRASLISLVVAVVLFGVKFWAWHLTGSTAILSDALESIVNIVASAVAAFSVWFASRPADENHPYGHGKVEDFSAGFEGALIVLAAVGILISAVPRFFDPAVLERIDSGLLLVFAAAVVNLVLGLFLVRQGRRHFSRALEADGRHVLADVITSAGAIGALIVVSATGWLWVDPLVACLIAGQILFSGFGLIRESVGRLMDEADVHVLDRVSERLQESRPPHWIDVHELRAWWAGDVMHVDLHMALPRYWSIEQSYAEATALEQEIGRAEGRRSSVVVHVDPCRPRMCPECAVENCPVRASEFVGHRVWTKEHLVRTVPPEIPAERGEAESTPDARSRRDG